MKVRFALACVAVGAAFIASTSGALAQSCGTTAKDVAVQILGSGGPLAGPNRASTSYVVWIGGRARVLVDIGGGAFLPFGQAQARLNDLSLIAITHLHPDHVSDLPPNGRGQPGSQT